MTSNRIKFYPFLIITFYFLISGCGQGNTNSVAQTIDTTHIEINATDSLHIDSVAIVNTFQRLKMNNEFLHAVGLEKRINFSWNDDSVKILRGDLDDDGVEDALLFFSVEDYNDGKYSDKYYIVFLQKNKQWIYQNLITAGGAMADRILEFEQMQNGIIAGNLVANKNQSLPLIPVEYVFRDGKMINSFTALHKRDSLAREFLTIRELLTDSIFSIPLSASLNDYEQILGKGTIIIPEKQPECGTYFEEGVYSELNYASPELVIELTDNKNGAWKSLVLKGSNFKVNTDKGTITSKTTLQELQSVFYKKDSWDIQVKKDGSKIFKIPDGEESDNQIHIQFDKYGKIERLNLFIPC